MDAAVLGLKSLLGQAAQRCSQLDFTLLVVGHSLTVAAMFRGRHGDRWLVNFWVGLLAAFGGGMASALLLQDAALASNALLASNAVGLFWTLSWWLINYCPGGLAARAHALLPVRAASKACLGVLRARTLAVRVDAAVVKFPGVVAAPLVLGTLAACGGKLIVDAIHLSAGYEKGDTELSAPGLSLRSSALCAALYWASVHALRVLSVAEGLGLVTCIYVAHGLLVDFTGQPWDYTAPLARLFHTVTLIPAPGAAPARAAGGRAKAAPKPKAKAVVVEEPEPASPKKPASAAKTPRTTRRKTLIGKKD